MYYSIIKRKELGSHEKIWINIKYILLNERSQSEKGYILYQVCPAGIQLCNMKKRDIYWRRYKIQETLYIGQWCFSLLQSRCLGTSHGSPNCHQLPPSCFSASHRWSEIYSLSKVILVLEKPEVTRHQIRVIGGLSHPGELMFCQITAWDVMYEQAHCPNESANHQLPIAAAFWIIRIVSREEFSSLMQNLMQIHYPTCSVILNATPHSTHAHSMASTAPTEDWSHHCSHMRIPVHSPWLPGYIDVVQ